jgi:hypothetical protein
VLRAKKHDSINNIQDLVAVGANNVNFNIYGSAVGGVPGMGLSGGAFAYTDPDTNQVRLGESFFDPTLPNSYNSVGGCTTNTVLHEFFHLASVGKDGNSISDIDLNNIVGGNFSDIMRTNCGCN